MSRMNNNLINEIVNHPNFIWMEGMLAYVPESEEYIRLTEPVVERWNKNNNKSCLPVIEDPATIGCVVSRMMPHAYRNLLESLKDFKNNESPEPNVA